MPKKGKLNKEEKGEEKEKLFVKYRKRHSAIESNINELEHRGLNRCPDRKEKQFYSICILIVDEMYLKPFDFKE